MSQLVPNLAQVAAKVLDGEAVLINLETGVYYSTDGVGAFAWQLLEAGCHQDMLAPHISQAYSVELGTVANDLDTWLASLVKESLLISGTPTSTDLPTRADDADYSKPELQVYRDMGALLALDPPAPRLDETPWKEASV